MPRILLRKAEEIFPALRESMNCTNSEKVLVGPCGEIYPASHDANQAMNIKAEEVSDAQEEVDPVQITVQEDRTSPENVLVGPYAETYPTPHDANQAISIKAKAVSHAEEEEVPVPITFPEIKAEPEELQAHASLESIDSQDGPVLKLKISRTEPASSTKVVSFQKLLPRESISGLEELLLPKPTCGHPPKRVYPSTSKESSSGSRSQRRNSSGSVADEPWSPSSKRSRMPSVDPVYDQYRRRRERNNVASRKSRQNRTAREREMKEVAAKLEQENENLKIRADEMEQLVKKLNEALLEAVVKTEKV
ncbi:hypothetical protein B7P43_G08358 [Cryptotermes secundus]|uniref:BZIP domain-containing protein n=1 Tax=Cryptotermes secundus TaxID=105785 RepID=A0A2J7Q8T7_9NEOP|nr:CCAAT/enhancer-binding protein beta [Cryptotermes secundus]XP_023716070.1 CCAAT/enhancer-binding protein beta [Cryptotermes secundus]PNF24986.1 hypothetical protein B7P43_G08358 [Cryptotermes secundus]